MLDETIVLKMKKGDYKWFEEINYMKNIWSVCFINVRSLWFWMTDVCWVPFTNSGVEYQWMCMTLFYVRNHTEDKKFGTPTEHKAIIFVKCRNGSVAEQPREI